VANKMKEQKKYHTVRTVKEKQ